MRRTILTASKQLGLFDRVREGRWRRERLLILCYHGISQDDEHEWDPSLYMSPAFFRGRLELLRAGGYRVLPLGEALHGLFSRTLPPKSVAITFDDGCVDFYRQACPILEEFSFPATVYLSTYYCDHNVPVFDVFCSYVLWKASAVVDAATLPGLEDWRGPADLGDPAQRQAVLRALRRFADAHQLSGVEKNGLVAELASRLGVDMDALVRRRLLHLMTPDEVARLPAGLIDVQMHTHRHRTPLDRELFLEEIVENRARIRAMTRSGAAPTHFCYPSGLYRQEFLPWLQEAGVQSATTCVPGYATSDDHPLLLPRLVDTSLLPRLDFEGWLAGITVPLRAWRRAL